MSVGFWPTVARRGLGALGPKRPAEFSWSSHSLRDEGRACGGQRDRKTPFCRSIFASPPQKCAGKPIDGTIPPRRADQRFEGIQRCAGKASKLETLLELSCRQVTRGTLDLPCSL